jgi:hypothetical protein
MSYTGTQGQTGNGSIFAVNTGTVTTPVWTVIGEAVDITPTGYENKTDDGTNLQSSAVERVFTIKDGGTWDFTANRVSTDTGQAAMAAAFASGATTMFKVTLPKEAAQTSVGDSFAFTAIVAKWVPSIKVDKIVKIAGSCATTNGITLTEGS